MPAIEDEFPLDPDVVLLNHVSFGVPTTRMMQYAEQVRRRIEGDAAWFLADGLIEELRAQRDAAAGFLGAPPGNFALTMNATEASAAVASSLGRRRGLRVAMLDTEYPSVIRAWQIAAGEHGGSVQLVRSGLPVASGEEVVDAFERQIEGPLDVVVASFVTSPTALVLPVREIVKWAGGRGAISVIDAAHTPGHLDVNLGGLGAAVVYGTLHKWLPVPRPLGFLYVADELRDRIRPAAVAIGWDDGFAERFAWRGTWDPTPALCFSAGFDQWREWQSDGLLAHAGRMADVVSERLTALGLEPTGSTTLVAPRFRAFQVPELTEDELRKLLDAARVRAWVGATPSGATLIRVATHVYTTDDHVRRLVGALAIQPTA